MLLALIAQIHNNNKQNTKSNNITMQFLKLDIIGRAAHLLYMDTQSENCMDFQGQSEQENGSRRSA